MRRSTATAAPRLWGMSMTVDLPEELGRRLEAEAARRGVTVDVIVAELVASIPPAPSEDAGSRRLAFVGIGASGRTEPLDIRRERAELARKRRADGT